MSDNEITILMAYVLVADTWGICIIATTGVVVLAEFIPSQRLSQTCPSMGVGTGGYFLPLPGPIWSFSTSTNLVSTSTNLVSTSTDLVSISTDHFLAVSCPFVLQPS